MRKQHIYLALCCLCVSALLVGCFPFASHGLFMRQATASLEANQSLLFFYGNDIDELRRDGYAVTSVAVIEGKDTLVWHLLSKEMADAWESIDKGIYSEQMLDVFSTIPLPDSIEYGENIPGMKEVIAPETLKEGVVYHFGVGASVPKREKREFSASLRFMLKRNEAGQVYVCSPDTVDRDGEVRGCEPKR